MKNLDVFLAVILSGVLMSWSNAPEAVKILLAVMAIDIITGAIRAIVEKNLSSADAWKGVSRKIITMLLVLATNVLGAQVVTEPLAGPLSVAVASFYIFVEAVSIVDNAAAVGVPIPTFLREALNKVTTVTTKTIMEPAKSITTTTVTGPTPDKG